MVSIAIKLKHISKQSKKSIQRNSVHVQNGETF